MQIRIYDRLWVIKDLISEKEIISYDIQFWSQINSWQRDCEIEINRDFRTLDYVSWDIVEVIEFDDNNKTWYPLYTGYIYDKKKSISWKVLTTTLWIFWILAILDDYPFINSWNYSFTLTMDPKTMVQAIIDSLNSQTGFLWTNTQNLWNNIIFMSSNSQNYWSNINLEFKYISCKEAIKKVVEKTNFYFFLKPNWEFIFAPKPTIPTHFIKQKTHTNSILQEEIPQDLVNCVHIKRASGQIKYYSNSQSISDYWKRYWWQVDASDVQDESTLDIYWNNYISERKDLKVKTTIDLKNDYQNIIYPGETIKIIYWDVQIDNAQVNRIDYSKQKRVLYLDKYTDVWDLLILKK